MTDMTGTDTEIVGSETAISFGNSYCCPTGDEPVYDCDTEFDFAVEMMDIDATYIPSFCTAEPARDYLTGLTPAATVICTANGGNISGTGCVAQSATYGNGQEPTTTIQCKCMANAITYVVEWALSTWPSCRGGLYIYGVTVFATITFDCRDIVAGPTSSPIGYRWYSTVELEEPIKTGDSFEVPPETAPGFANPTIPPSTGVFNAITVGPSAIPTLTVTVL